jgi:hypothetical protein
MTNQQIADHDLALWQGAPRGLTPAEKMELLFFDFLMPPAPVEVEYEVIMRKVREEMAI